MIRKSPGVTLEEELFSASFVTSVRYDEVSRRNLVHIRCITFSGSDLTWVLAWRQILDEEPYERFLDLRREAAQVLQAHLRTVNVYFFTG